MLDSSIIRIVQAAFRAESGLTHKLTHWTKFAGGNSGRDSMNELLISEQKGLKSLRNAQNYMLGLVCNQQAGGSNPSTSSKIAYGGVPEWPKGTDCKSAGDAFGGSNPPSSTIKALFL